VKGFSAMPDEKKLIKQFNQGSKDSLCQIYQRYKNDLYGFAMSLLHEANAAEDVVHDVFVSFAQKSGTYTLKGKLRNYLLASVANRARDLWRQKSQNDVALDAAAVLPRTGYAPEQDLILAEEYAILQKALSKIPYQQLEIILLHLHHEMTFRQIARAQGVSINTIQSRYRYGLEKLRSLLKEGCEHEPVQTNRRPDSANEA
jgi:RNA polymerase sigma-70 factor (ECF subfamily)